MRNFTRMALGALTVATLGLSSCVDDQISSEVKAIYDNQASYIGAQAELKKAEADLKNAQVAYQALVNANKESQNAADAANHALQIENAKNALQVAQQNHIRKLLDLKKQLQDTKDGQVNSYLGKYMAELSEVIDNRSEIATHTQSIENKQRELALLKASVDGNAFNYDESVKLKELEIPALESALAKDQAKLKMLEEVLSKPTSIGAQVIAIQKQIDDLKAERDNRSARIDEITNTELPVYGDDLSDYQTARTDLEAKKQATEGADVALVAANKAVTDANAELTELLGGAAAPTYEAALDAKTAAKAVKKEKNDAYAAISSLAADYSALINDIATIDAQIVTAQTNISNINTNLSTLEGEYNLRKSIFDGNPSGKTVTNAGADDKAGNPNDTSTVTYYACTNAAADPITYAATAYYSASDIPLGGTITAGATPVTGEYFNVEADDTVQTNQSLFDAAQSAFVGAQVLLSNAQADLTQKQAELAELKAKQAEYDGTLGAKVAAARTASDEADAAYTLASDTVSKLEAITAAENAVLDAEKAVADAKQEEAEAQSEVTRLGALIDSTKLDKYEELKDQIDDLTLKNKLAQKEIDDLEGDITYFGAIKLELEASNYSGADYEERMEKIAEKIKDQKEIILDDQKAIANAKNELEDLKQKRLNVDTNRASLVKRKEAEIAELKARIERLEADIVEHEKLAARYKTLLDEAMSA